MASRAARNLRNEPNLFDMPELMLGAQPSAKPAQRETFERRCKELHTDATLESAAANAVASVGAPDLEAMFPMLDAALVRTLQAEAPSAQHAIDMLLALSAAMSEPVAGGQPRATSPPPRQIGVEDHEKFPLLVTSEGWQIVTQRQLLHAPEEDLGCAWRDRAKAAADMPAPHPAPVPATGYARRRPSRQKVEPAEEPEPCPTDYDFRHSAGQRRAQHRTQFGRGGRGAARGGRGASAWTKGDESEEEEQDEDGITSVLAEQ